MATIAISCPKCEKQIKAPSELVGKKIRCKECQTVFVVTAPAGAPSAAKGAKPAKAAPAKEEAPARPRATDMDESDGKSYGMTETSTLPRCPYCAQELETEDQVICLHCGYNRTTRERIATKKTLETSGGDQFLWLLPGILCAVGVLGMIGLIVVFWVVFPDMESDHKDDWWVFTVGKPGRIWGTVICSGVAVILTYLAILRLVLNPTPPEREKLK